MFTGIAGDNHALSESRTDGHEGKPLLLGCDDDRELANTDHDACIRIIHKALDFGINFIDIADRYSDGESEAIVGKALKGRRDHVVLATKFTGAMGQDPNQQGASRRWIVQAVEGSLRRLRTDHIDLYQVHRMPADTDVEEILLTLTDLMRDGKIRAFDASTVPASDIVEAQHVAERRGLARFRTEQPPYSILNRTIEREVLPTCQRYGMGVMEWVPLAKGMLTGKYRKGETTPDSLRAKFFPKAMSDESSLDAVEQLIPLAESADISLMHMALAFVVAHPALPAAIIDPRTEEQLDGLLSGATVRLSDKVLDRIGEIVPPGVDLAPLEGAAYASPAISNSLLCRRNADERAAA